jgi:hypothetical protein
MGDWNGDGTATLGVLRNGRWFLRHSNTLAPVSWCSTLEARVTRPTGRSQATGMTTGLRRSDCSGRPQRGQSECAHDVCSSGAGVYRQDGWFYLRNAKVPFRKVVAIQTCAIGR